LIPWIMMSPPGETPSSFAPPFFVAHLRGVIGIGNPVLLLSEPEDVEMIVFPPHDFLDHSMETWEGDRAGDQEAPPDRRQYLP